MKTVLVTGAAGFIGSNFLKKICLREDVKNRYCFVIADALTYAGFYPTIQNDIEENKHLEFVHLDLRDRDKVEELFVKYAFDGVLNFAAESHVDRSILNPNIFVETNVLGTLNLLNESKKIFEKRSRFRFLQVSTDEVYGSLSKNDPAFTETTLLAPNSPYSASKASADFFVRSFFETFKLPTLITRCSNNYGPYQFPEKLIPLMIHNARNEIPLPVYGKGENIRDWIFVDDHNLGVWEVYERGSPGEVYNLGGDSEMINIDIVKMILRHMKKSESLISFVEDRKGHDFRYAMNFSKMEKEFGWRPKVNFEEGLVRTIAWYEENTKWVQSVKEKEKC